MSRFPTVLRRSVPMLLATGVAHAQMPGGAPAVGTMQAHRAPVVETSEYVGRIQAIDSVALIARVTGYLDQRLFTEGSEVTKGQLLYVIEQPPYQAAVEADQGALDQAQAQVAFAQVQFERQQRLLNTPAGQKSNYDQTLSTARSQAAAVLTAAANLKTAQINLDYTSIRAPVDGRITATAVNPGNVVGPTSGTLATIETQDPMYVLFPISERDLFSLEDKYNKTGGLASLHIKLKLNTGAIYDADGKLDYVAPVVANTTDTVTLRATIPNPKRGNSGAGDRNAGTGDRQLVSGEFVTVQLAAPQPIELLTIPQAAVLSDQQGSYVFTVGSDDVAHRVNIHTGEQTGTNVAVLSGLPDDSTVIVDGIQRVHDGGKVAPGAPQQTAVASPSSVTTNPQQAQDNARNVTPPGGSGNGSGAAGR